MINFYRFLPTDRRSGRQCTLSAWDVPPGTIRPGRSAWDIPPGTFRLGRSAWDDPPGTSRSVKAKSQKRKVAEFRRGKGNSGDSLAALATLATLRQLSGNPSASKTAETLKRLKTLEKFRGETVQKRNFVSLLNCPHSDCPH